ncbi:MAG: hypothetical protein DRQ39_08460 [Gammaproteobacteria bacterium]|nr:MAG: hypothetical protein DRQ39_08460 [Gammaproteobacteria bacterium]
MTRLIENINAVKGNLKRLSKKSSITNGLKVKIDSGICKVADKNNKYKAVGINTAGKISIDGVAVGQISKTATKPFTGFRSACIKAGLKVESGNESVTW